MNRGGGGCITHAGAVFLVMQLFWGVIYIPTSISAPRAEPSTISMLSFSCVEMLLCSVVSALSGVTTTQGWLTQRSQQPQETRRPG